MSTANAILKAQVDKAHASAVGTINPCCTCIPTILDNLKLSNYKKLKLCRFWVKEMRRVQSKAVYIQANLIDSEDNDTICRCNACYLGGRDCWQIPEENLENVSSALTTLMPRTSRVDAYTRDEIDLSGLDEAVVRAAAQTLEKEWSDIVVTTGSKFCGNPLTPYHSGYDTWPPEGILPVVGISGKERKKRKAAAVEKSGPASPTAANPSTPKRKKTAPELSAFKADVLATLDFLAGEIKKKIKTKGGQESFRQSYEAHRPADD